MIDVKKIKSLKVNENGLILNPKTNRWVKPDGKVGQIVLATALKIKGETSKLPLKSLTKPIPVQKELPNDVLQLIADFSDNKTKNKIRMIGKLGKELVPSPAPGNKHAAYLKEYLLQKQLQYLKLYMMTRSNDLNVKWVCVELRKGNFTFEMFYKTINGEKKTIAKFTKNDLQNKAWSSIMSHKPLSIFMDLMDSIVEIIEKPNDEVQKYRKKNGFVIISLTDVALRWNLECFGRQQVIVQFLNEYISLYIDFIEEKQEAVLQFKVEGNVAAYIRMKRLSSDIFEMSYYKSKKQVWTIQYGSQTTDFSMQKNFRDLGQWKEFIDILSSVTEITELYQSTPRKPSAMDEPFMNTWFKFLQDYPPKN
jgi:hypothetical protein